MDQRNISKLSLNDNGSQTGVTERETKMAPWRMWGKWLPEECGSIKQEGRGRGGQRRRVRSNEGGDQKSTCQAFQEGKQSISQ